MDSIYAPRLLQEMNAEVIASGIDPDNLNEIRGFIHGFIRRVADRTGHDKTEVANELAFALLLDKLETGSSLAGERIRERLAYTTDPGGLLIDLDLEDVVKVCGGLPFGDAPDESGRLVPVAALTGNDVRLMVFDMAASGEHTGGEVMAAASNAVGWIAALGDLTFGQWIDTQRDEDGNYPISSGPARRATWEERLETAARAGHTD